MSLARNAGFCGEPNPLASPTSARMTSVERPHRRQLGEHLDPRVGPGPLVVLGVEWADASGVRRIGQRQAVVGDLTRDRRKLQ
jgi:hypothetical protein